MFRVDTHKPENLLTIVFSQHVDAEEAKACAEKVKGALQDMQPGFRLLTDLSELGSMDADCAPHIRMTMDLCSGKGVAKVVRVIPDPRRDIGLNIMSLFHYRRRISIVTCATNADALKALADDNS